MTEAATGNATTADDAAVLVAFVRERDVECPLCRYNLRGLMTPRCPECGRELRLSIGLVEPRQGAWLLCQIATAATGGVGVLAWVSLIKDGWQNSVVDSSLLFQICFVSFMTAPALATAVFFLRRRFLRLAERTQWGLAIAACAFAVLTISGMFIAEL